MKGSQKRRQSNSTDSVIGMLMGFDEPPPQRIVPDKRRVLSESYLHKVASISLRPGSSVPIGRSCRTDNYLVDGVKGASRVRKVLDKCVNSSSSNARSRVRSSEPEHYAGRRVLRRRQKLEHDFVSNSLNVALDVKDKPLPFSSNVSGFKHSIPEYRELGKSLVPEIGKPHHEFSWKELAVKGNVSGHSCVACTQSMRRISPPERPRSKFEDVLKAEYKGYGHDPHLDQSSFANKSRKKYFDRRKAVEKIDRFGVSEMPRNLVTRLCTNGSSSSISNLASQYIHDSSYESEEAVNAEDFTRINGDPLLKSYPGILLEEGAHSSNVEEINSREASLNELSEEESAYSKCSGIGPLENLKRTSQHSPNSVLESNDTNNPTPFECFDSIGLLLQLQALNFELEEALSERSAILVSRDEDVEELFGDLSHDGRKIKRWLGDEESRNFSYLVDVLDEAGLYDTNSFMDFNKWASLECPISPLGFDALEKKYGKQVSWQKSERLLLFDCINSGLLGIYYPFINFHDGAIFFCKKLCSPFRRDEVVEELWTVKKEDVEELFGDQSHHDVRKIKRWLGDEESRNFSDLVDVLDEAGLYDTNSFMDFNKWASLECPISPLGFDALEKKYGKQASWQKSERLLLFGRINSGLLGIYYPFINFHDGAISFRKKLCSPFRRDEVVEELWTMKKEDVEELFGDQSHHDGREIKRWLGDEESRNFSYLVDVLDEAGLHDTNSFMDFNKWASLECPISPLLFDALEKKYGKQAYWQKSERLLLFDRINSGLLGIYYPFINFHAGAISFRKKLRSPFRRDEVVDELWTMLISQENGKSKDSPEKALDNWWEFKEGVNIICGELEASLFNELVMELASL